VRPAPRILVMSTALALAAAACGDDLGPDEPPVLLDSGVSAGHGHSCAVLNDGRAACWGRGSDGALGTGDTRNAWGPRFVDSPARFVEVSAGRDHTCGVTAEGVALCWGANDHGQLGNETTTSTLEPGPVSGGLTFRRISAGDDFTCGVTTERLTPRIIDTAKHIAKERGEVSLIVVDTLAVTFGGGDENKSEDMGVYVANIKQSGFHRLQTFA
jgi:hypothetical protein